MKKIQLIAPIIGALAMAMMATTASAAPGIKLDKSDISSAQCKPKGAGAQPLVDVHFTILNDADSGFDGNVWANDTFNRHLRIYQLDDGTYCVNVADHGTFVTFAGTSPNGESTVPAGIKGEMEGGYSSNFFTGTFSASSLPTRGNLGNFDMGCNQAGTCLGLSARPSFLSYFSVVNGANAFQEWGWIYRAGKHGTWLNQDDVAAADSGNIQ